MTTKFLIPVLVGAAGVALALSQSPAAAEGADTGSVHGTIEFRGKAPRRKPLARDTDPHCKKFPKLSEEIVVHEGKLRDVHVRIKTGTAGDHRAPASPVVINQNECMYSPRVFGMMAGQKVVIKNRDPTYHNVRGAKEKRTLWNLGQPANAADIVRENLGKAGEVITLHCDVHPWMRAYAVITDHPFFDVTAADGAFALDRVPTGTYTLEAWHPKLGLKSKKITIRAGKTTSVSLQF